MQRNTLDVRRLWQLNLHDCAAVAPGHERDAGNWQQLTDLDVNLWIVRSGC
jgi:hypothetical protein